LGLAICREVAVKHGGSLSVESEQDKGSQFFVRLPFKMHEIHDEAHPSRLEKQPEIAEAAQEGGSADPEATVEPFAKGRSAQEASDDETLDSLEPFPQQQAHDMEPLEHFAQDTGTLEDFAALPKGSRVAGHLGDAPTDVPTVLHVDDDENSQALLMKSLGEAYNVVQVSSGRECMDYLEECAVMPDLVLLDVVMPSMSGIEVLAAIRESHSMISLPVVMTFAGSSAASVVKGIENGCNDWVHKPFDCAELLARVKSQIRHKGLVQERLGECVHRDVLRAAVPDSLLQQLLDQAGVPKAAAGQRRKQVRRRPASEAPVGRHGTPRRKGADEELTADAAVAASAAKAEVEQLRSHAKSLKQKQLEEDRSLARVQERLDQSHSQKQGLEREVKELQGRIEKLRLEKYRSEQSRLEPEVTTVPEPTVAEAWSSSPAPAVEVTAAEPATTPAATTLANVTAAISKALKALPGGRLERHDAQVVMQLSHLALEARLKERTVEDLRAKLQQQSALLYDTEERCRWLEHTLRRMRLDSALLGERMVGGPMTSPAAAPLGA